MQKQLYTCQMDGTDFIHAEADLKIIRTQSERPQIDPESTEQMNVLTRSRDGSMNTTDGSMVEAVVDGGEKLKTKYHL